MENQIIGMFIRDENELKREEAHLKIKPSYKRAIEELKKLGTLNEDDLKLIHVYLYDSLDKDGEFQINKVITLETANRTATLDFFQIERGEEITEEVNATITNGVITTGINIQKSIVEVVFERETEEEIDPLVVNLPDYEDYVPGMINDVIGTEASFCLKWDAKNKMYHHCGPDCGEFGSKGGGSAINKLDGCCVIHDYCYKHDVKSVSCCDKQICDCSYNSRNVDYATYLQIKAWFGHMASHCKK